MACLPPRLVLASTAPVLVLLLFVPLSPCRAASGSSPSAVLLPVDKDGATQQYVTMFWQRTPSVPVKAVVDLAGAMLWVDCESGYESSSYARVPCGSKPCRLAKSAACATGCSGAASPGCLNDTCTGFPEYTITRVSTGGNIITDKLSLYTTCRPMPVPRATAPGFLFTCGDKSTEYFIGVTGIKVNGRAVPLNATLLAIAKSGVGGTKLSMLSPYTVLETSIYKAVTDAFAAETAMIPRVPAVAPFKLCYDGTMVGSTRAGPAVPTVELVLQSKAVSWVVFGANSMVATKDGALCFGVVDGGVAPETSVVIGGHMMEDNLLEFDLEGSRLGFTSYLPLLQTTCNSFHLG
ncbi:Os05g0403100 [Oryza sativa Japonica Group]|uniref:Os05g0403100 protein n=1 Tax=Oryza sativa subsp. japonica TaxID=39947 RepID=A0A0N7KKR2_ORYSJ|nr:Os05g0403100 [Oryza sativa Japonica Group]